MAALEKVYVFYSEPVTIRIAPNSDGSELKKAVADVLYDIAGRPRGALELLLPPELQLRYGKPKVVEGKGEVLVLDPEADLDVTFFATLVSLKEQRKQYRLEVVDIPSSSAPQVQKETGDELAIRALRDLSRRVAGSACPFDLKAAREKRAASLAERVEHQKEALGSLFKRPILGTGLPGTKLAEVVHLGKLEGGEEQEPCMAEVSEADGRTVLTPLSTLVRDIASTISVARNAIVLLGPSGIGKTTAIFETAKRYFVFFMDVRDGEFDADAAEVGEWLARNRQPPGERTLEGESDIQEGLRRTANLVLGRRFASRLLFLQYLFDLDPNISPEDLLYCQFNGGKDVLARAYELCKGLSVGAISKLVISLRASVIAACGGRGPFWAIDEANGLSALLAQKTVSRTCYSSADAARSSWIEDKRDWVPSAKRPFLALVGETLQHFQLPAIFSGTALSLGHAKMIFSSLAKLEYKIYTVNRWPTCTDPMAFFESNLDLSRVELTEDLVQIIESLAGRYRTSTNAIALLLRSGDRDFAGAIEKAKASTLAQLVSSAAAFHASMAPYSDGLFASLLRCWDLNGGNVEWGETTIGATKLVEFLCTVESILEGAGDGSEDASTYAMRITEPLAMEAIRRQLPGTTVQSIWESVSLFRNVVSHLGVSTSAKGNALEPVARHALAHFNGTAVIDLPFLGSIRDKLVGTWAETCVINITQAGTSKELQSLIEGYIPGVRGDMLFLVQRVTNAMLVEHNQTRQDGVWFFDDRVHAGSLGMTLSVNRVSSAKHRDQVASTDIRNSFSGTKGIRAEFRSMDARNPAPLSGILRIHLEFPEPVETSYMDTYLASNGDIMAFITVDNMDEFFVERGDDARWVECMRSIKNAIRSVCCTAN
eukprot:m51a1_g9541 hypothetical protein (884) ;mRNA; f:840877-843745